MIIVNFNAGIWLERCVAAVCNQSLPPLEVIVVDNASSDGSVERLGDRFPCVQVIHARENMGFSAANNLAVRAVSCRSTWLVLLNPDAFPEPTWLKALLNAAYRNPEYAVFGSRLMDAKKPLIVDGTGDIYHLSGLVWRADHGNLFNSSDCKCNEIFSPCGAAAMYRKDAFLASGGFDEDLFCYVEDVDLGFRLRLLGHRCLYVPESVVYHVGSAVTGRRSDFSIYHGHRNLVWAFVKNMPGVLFWILLPAHLALNLVSVIYFAAQGKGPLILRAKWDSIKGMPAMWRKRQLIQSTRVATIREVWRLLDKRVIPARQVRAGKS